jgi:hypothetical protein
MSYPGDVIYDLARVFQNNNNDVFEVFSKQCIGKSAQKVASWSS